MVCTFDNLCCIKLIKKELQVSDMISGYATLCYQLTMVMPALAWLLFFSSPTLFFFEVIAFLIKQSKNTYISWAWQKC